MNIKKIQHIIKSNFLVLIIFLLFIYSAFSQESKTNYNYEQSKFALNYNYYGFPFFVEAGYTYRKNSSQIFFPLVGISMEEDTLSFNLFLNAKMKYRYKRFYLELGFKQGLIPSVGEGYEYKNLENYGQFRIGHYFENAQVSYNLNVGNIYARNIYNKELSNTFKVNHNVNVNSLLHSDAANTLTLDTSFEVNTMPNNAEYSYSFSARMPYTFYHYWGEFSIMPYISYSEYFEDSKKNYSIGGNYLDSLMMTAITGTKEQYQDLYNFLSYMHLEYRFYLRFLPDAFSSIYLVAYGNIGYGKKVSEEFYDGEILYTAGGGVGYNMFGSVPMQLTLGVDRLNHLVINYVISTTIHKF